MTYDDTTATSGITYYYWVRAFRGLKGGRHSGFSANDTNWRSP